MTMTKEFENSENEIKYTTQKYVRNNTRKQIFKKQQKQYKNLFSMTLTSDYIASSCKNNEYVELTSDLKRIKSILAHSDDARLRAMATAQQKLISKKLKKHNGEREHLYRILKLYRMVTQQDDDVGQKLKELVLTTYYIPVTVISNAKITTGYIPASYSVSRFSSETLDRISHASTKPKYDIKSNMMNVDDMS